MINCQLLFKNIREGRCVRSNVPLKDGEFVISRVEMPGLYGGLLPKGDRAYLKKVFEYLEPSDTSDKLISSLIEKGDALSLQRFYLQVMELVPDLLESVLHQYIHRFWAVIDSSEVIGFPTGMDTFYKCKGPTDSIVESYLLQKLRKAGCHCDIVGHSRNDRCLWLIDAKRDEVDDRAVGQIRRYYEIANEIIATCEVNVSVRLVRPVLICREVTVSRFFSLGLPFRDVCEIWVYKIERSRLVLHDKRLQLLGQIRKRMHLSQEM